MRLDLGFTQTRMARRARKKTYRTVARYEGGCPVPQAYVDLLLRLLDRQQRKRDGSMKLNWENDVARRRTASKTQRQNDRALAGAGLRECWMCLGAGIVKKSGIEEPCRRCGAVGFLEKRASPRKAITVPGQPRR